MTPLHRASDKIRDLAREYRIKRDTTKSDTLRTLAEGAIEGLIEARLIVMHEIAEEARQELIKQSV